MTRQHAKTTVAAPLAAVQARLADVAHWPAFLSGLESAEPAGFERWHFTLGDGRSRRTVTVCVQPHPAEHRIAWHALEGPRYLGEFRLRAVDDGHTTVELTTTADPAKPAEGFRELLGERHTTTAQLDLQRLDAFVTSEHPA
jgi:uncharacterized membrane protein